MSTAREEMQGKRIRELLARVEDLEQQVQDLETALTEPLPEFLHIELTKSERVLLGLLASRPLVSKATFMMAHYSTRGDDQPLEKIIDVFVCKLRRKLKQAGLEIETVWGQGYRLPEDSKQKLKSMKEAAA